MATYHEEVMLDSKTVKALRATLDWKEGDPEDARFGEDDTYTIIVDFNDHMSMYIKVCGVQYDCPESSNNSWSEAVLLDRGCEVACTDPDSDLLGDWELEYDGNVYVVTVVEEAE